MKQLAHIQSAVNQSSNAQSTLMATTTVSFIFHVHQQQHTDCRQVLEHLEQCITVYKMKLSLILETNYKDI